MQGTLAALEPQVLSAIRGGDAVIVKGSLGSRMAPIVKALQRLSARHDMSESGASSNGTLQAASAQG